MDNNNKIIKRYREVAKTDYRRIKFMYQLIYGIRNSIKRPFCLLYYILLAVAFFFAWSYKGIVYDFLGVYSLNAPEFQKLYGQAINAAIIIVFVMLLFTIIIIIGTPPNSRKYTLALLSIGLHNRLGTPPIIILNERTKKGVFLLRIYGNNVPMREFIDKGKINEMSSVMNITVLGEVENYRKRRDIIQFKYRKNGKSKKTVSIKDDDF